MTEIWNKQCITLLEIKAISCKLHENFIMNTLNDISNTDKYPKLRTYKTFITEFRKLFINIRKSWTQNCTDIV